MPVHAREQIGLGGVGLLIQQAGQAENHAGSAVAALEGAFGEEGLLDGMERFAFGEPLDCQDGLFVGIGNCGHAGDDAFSADQDCAGAALAFATAVFGAGQLQVLTQHVEQRAFWIGRDGPGLTVNGESNGFFHTF